MLLSDRNDLICRMYQDGNSLEDVGQAFELTRERVRQILVQKGVTARWTKQAKLNTNLKPQIRDVHDLYLQGYTRKEAVKKLNLTVSLVTIHDRLGRLSKEDKYTHSTARFWQQVDKNGPVSSTLGTRCWLWTGYINEVSGYGHTICNALTKKSSWAPHYIAWVLVKGEPENWVLLRCENKHCCNPDHHYDGTAKESAAKRDAKNAGTLLGAEQITDLKDCRASGESLESLAER